MHLHVNPQPTKTVLLAEEDDDTRDQLADELRHDGYHVVAVEDGLELSDYLELANLSSNHLPKPALIVSDVHLSGRDGVEICTMLSTDEHSAPIILLAPVDEPEVWENAERAGAAHVLDKPVDVDELLEAVAAFAEDDA